MILVDAHVHIHNCFDLEKLFDSAYSNFRSEAVRSDCDDEFAGVLLLAETYNDNWFKYLINYAEGKKILKKKKLDSWSVRRTAETSSLYINSDIDRHLFLIAGRQIITSENIEILALVTSESFENGLGIVDTIGEINNKEGIQVLPWGAGKWLGNRGKIISNIIRSKKSNSLFLGDNSGRPIFWKRPRHFKIAQELSWSILPGSDALPFASEQRRVGSFGFWVDRTIDPKRPAQSIKKILSDEKIIIHPYGKLESIPLFIINQIRMQFRKRIQ